MADALSNHTFTPTVGIAQLPSASYPTGTESDNPVAQALSRLADTLGWSDERGPFGKVISKGARVLIKPNLVLHQNEGSSGLDCLVTHASVIRAAVEAALRTEAAEVLVGDAPIQGCDFEAMVEGMGLRAWARERSARDPRFKGPQDFRRTTGVLVHGVRVASENLQPIERFTLFNLGRESILEPISNGDDRFRVSWYDHRLLAKTHYPGVHQYLVAREVVDADVIINLPKLKLHRKAGITCALKNLIGINGNKEYLPHHRLGGSKSGGDNYPGNSPVKRALEYVRDQQNTTSSRVASQGLSLIGAVLARTARGLGDHFGTDGSWSGNDTVWRTCLDLNRILLYGRPDGTMSDEIQRRVLHIADAVIAGQGNGPLAPDPLALGLLLGGNNAAAVDWVGAHFLALDPERVPLTRHAFDQFRWPIANSPSGSVIVNGDLGDGPPLRAAEKVKQPVNHPLGWRAAAAPQQAPPEARQEAAAPAGTSVSTWDA